MRFARVSPPQSRPAFPPPLPGLLPRSPRSFLLQIALGIGSAAAVVVATSVTKPLYVETAPLARQIIAHTYVDSTALRSPWLTSPTDVAVRTPTFLHDRQAFMMDLVRTGKVNPTRALQLADVAVREAYTRKLPPALVLGVMLTENDELKSTARSHVGAVGLMQVYPKHWLSALAAKFGRNVHTDSTNLKYGIYILGWVASLAAHPHPASRNWRTALLRDNGC